jgi:putative membrane protein
VASKKSLAVPDTMSPKHREAVARLQKLSGTEFDRAYMQMMVKDHQEDVEKFRTQAKSAKDPDVKAFAEKTLPTLETHLQMAKDISAEVSGATSGAARRKVD